jgi:TRAP transporter TAXI family solute receptor
MTAVDRPYTGYETFVPLTDKGSLDMAIGAMGPLFDAYRGHGYMALKGKCPNLRIICGGNSLMTAWIARPGSGIKTVKDLKGKRIAIDATSKATGARPRGLIRAAGLDPEKDVTLVPYAGLPAGIAALMEGRVDAAWCAVGTAATTEAYAKFGGIVWVSVAESGDDAGAKFIREDMPGEVAFFLKAGSAPQVDNDAWVVQSFNSLFSHKGFSDEAAYLIARALWKNNDQLLAIHPAFKTWHENMVLDLGLVPYHPGAIRFYKEIGAWSDKLDKLQQRGLSN